MSESEYRDIEELYRPLELGLFESEEDYYINSLKEKVFNLPEDLRRIFLVYTEMGNLRDAAKELGISHTTVNNKINKARKLILGLQ